jgi:sugar lactone lactonase YvrE
VKKTTPIRQVIFGICGFFHKLSNLVCRVSLRTRRAVDLPGSGMHNRGTYLSGLLLAYNQKETAMLSRVFSLRWSLLALTVGLMCGTSEFAAAQQSPPIGEIIGGHRHTPIDIDARPIIEKYRVPLVHPRRLLLDRLGNILVADWEAGTVVKVDAEGKSSIVVDGLIEPAGLAHDAMGNLYVSQHSEGMTKSGSVVRISPEGEKSVFAAGFSGPTALAFGPMGDLFVANIQDATISRVTPNGDTSTFVSEIPSPGALAFDKAGFLYAASSTDGIVFRINPMGDVGLLARGLQVPSDLCFDNKGYLIVSNYGGTELTYIDAKGNTRMFAAVPKGTIGHAFDALGNLVLVNWDQQYLMKVTTHLAVPCPHCEQKIPVRLRRKSTKKPEKKTAPVI